MADDGSHPLVSRHHSSRSGGSKKRLTLLQIAQGEVESEDDADSGVLVSPNETAGKLKSSSSSPAAAQSTRDGAVDDDEGDSGGNRKLGAEEASNASLAGSVADEQDGGATSAEMEAGRVAADSALQPAILPMTDVPLDDEDVLDVIIVGAGLSGLTTAYDLKKAGIDNVRIIEANG